MLSFYRTKMLGFSLIELMITVAIIGILAIVALPSYTSYVIRTNRSDGMDKLTEVAYELERFNNRNRVYTLDMTELGFANDPVLSDEGLYRVDATVCNGATLATCVLITAQPVAGSQQAADGNLTLDTRGNRGGNW